MICQLSCHPTPLAELSVGIAPRHGSGSRGGARIYTKSWEARLPVREPSLLARVRGVQDLRARCETRRNTGLFASSDRRKAQEFGEMML